MKRKISIVLITLALLTSATFPVSAANTDSYQDYAIVTPHYVAVSYAHANIKISNSIGTFECTYLLSDSSYTCDIELTAESSTNRRDWEEVESWSTSLSSVRGEFSKILALPRGYYYRTSAIINVYDKNGQFVEGVEATSSVEHY